MDLLTGCFSTQNFHTKWIGLKTRFDLLTEFYCITSVVCFALNFKCVKHPVLDLFTVWYSSFSILQKCAPSCWACRYKVIVAKLRSTLAENNRNRFLEIYLIDSPAKVAVNTWVEKQHSVRLVLNQHWLVPRNCTLHWLCFLESSLGGVGQTVL